MSNRKSIEMHQTPSGVSVTVFDTGEIRIEALTGVRCNLNMRIELDDCEVFEVMSFLASVKMPGQSVQ